MAVSQASELPPPWSTCEAVLSEAFHLIGERGARNLGALLRRRALMVAFRLPENLEPVLKLIQKYFRRSHGLRRCLPGSHDRNACRSHRAHNRPRFPSLQSPQPPSGSLCDARKVAYTEPSRQGHLGATSLDSPRASPGILARHYRRSQYQ
jgi:hypothetical protein